MMMELEMQQGEIEIGKVTASTPSSVVRGRAFARVDGVPSAGIEPATRGLGNRCSLH